jgi:hypothetical protein
MTNRATGTIKAFLVELVIYSVLVVIYFFFVLHLLADWLYELYRDHRYLYAIAAILLIAGQAVALEAVTTSLLKMIRGRSE